MEVPISASDRVRAADGGLNVRPSLRGKLRSYDPRTYLAAPDLCTEVVSPANTEREIAEKKALSFDARALELWLCQPHGSFEIFIP